MNHPASDALGRQVANSCRELITQPGLPVAAHLPEQQILDTFHDLGGTFRDRVYTPGTTMWTFIHQVLDPDHSCQQAVDRLLAYRAAEGLPDCSDDTGAYCRARARLPEELPHQLVRQTGRAEMEKADQQWLWKGRRVKVVDGTGLSMPDTPENQKEYPQPAELKPGVGFPLLRLVVVFCLSVGTVLDAAMAKWSGKGTGEVSLFRQLDDVLDPGDVLLGDRIYADFWDVARALARRADVVMRRHAGRKAVKFRGRGDGTGSRREGWRKPARPPWMTPEEYESYPDWIKVRVLRVVVRVRGFRTKSLVLVTTLLDGQAYSCDDLAELYRRCWQAEGVFRTYKRTLGKVKLMGRTVAQVHREAEGSLLAVQLLLAQGALALQSAGASPRVLPSGRQVLLATRAEIRNVVGMYLGPRQRQTYWQRLQRLRVDRRRHRHNQVRRRWPGRADHKPPKPPRILKMGTALKELLAKTLGSG